MEDLDFLFEDKIRNKTRKNILLLIYESPKRYQELATITNLKPGSVYHHLKILEPFVEKKGHGLYAITEVGRKMIEKHNLVSTDEKQPSITTLSFEKTKVEEIFTNRGTQVIGILVLLLAGHLAQLNVALAGGAIYASFIVPAYAIDFVSFVLGVGILAYVSSVFHIKDKIHFAILVRLYSMIPASLIGLSLLLVYHSGIALSTDFNTTLFTLSFLGGIAVSYAGTRYLLGKEKIHSIIYATASAIPDLFLGLGIILIET